MTRFEVVKGATRERRHDQCAPNCSDRGGYPLDEVAHCPRCCPRDDHRLYHADHKFLGVVVARWGHRTDPPPPKPFSMDKFPKVW